MIAEVDVVRHIIGNSRKVFDQQRSGFQSTIRPKRA
jgi:hypothetical protein